MQRTRSRRLKLLASVVGTALVSVLSCGASSRGAAAGPSWPLASAELAQPSGQPRQLRQLRIDVMDVGHGDAILITSPAGKTVLIDGGLADAGDRVAAFVHARTREPLDLVLLTHRHADHLGGLGWVISRQGARLFMDAAFPHPSPAYDRLIRVLEERHIPVRAAQRGRVIDLGGGARLVLLTPPDPLITGSRSDANANSVVTRLEFGRVRVLLTGDAEAVTEDWLLDSKVDLRADVLKVAHHGSRYSSSTRFLEAVRPRIAIASCGPLTQVGHIHPDTIARLEHTGARLYRTDRDGNVTVRTDGQSVTVETQHTPGLSGAQARR